MRGQNAASYVRFACVATVLLGCVALFGCGGETRSVTAVCEVWNTEGLELHDRFQETADAQDGGGADAGFSALVQLLAAPNDISHLMKQMSAVAPLTVADDFDKIAATLDELADSYGDTISNPLKALASNMGSALAAAGSYQRVDKFLAENCGIPGVKAPTNPQ